ncbi:MAG TPA: sulfotransferase [Fimbriimonas sp.]|nr:sulfotransferase [Fimbriimonas sp.]
MSNEVQSLLASANAAHAAGRLREAESLARNALGKDAENVQAHLLLGVLAGKTNRDAEARTHLERVYHSDPNSFEAAFWLSLLSRRGGKTDEAIGFAQVALKIRPTDAFGLNNLGLCLLDALRLEEAAEAFRKAALARPEMAQIHHNLGTALYMLGQDEEAAKAFDLALARNPRSVESFLGLGQTMISLTEPQVAEDAARRALSLAPQNVEAHLLLANALAENGRTVQAEDQMRKALALNPNDAKAHALLSMRLQSVGRFDEANEHLVKSMQLEPDQGFAYFAYAFNNKIKEKDRRLVETMERLTSEGGLPPREIDFLHYALGRSYESLGEYEKAWVQFTEANRLARKIKFGDEVFDRHAYSKEIDWLIETFSGELAAGESSSDLPILIVGMMRSGTTLAEQILSSHPEIGPAGEQRFWPRARPTMFGKSGFRFDASTLPPLASKYVNTLRDMAPGARHVTDKMPANYELLGPIHMALPNARLIHMRRDPMDTCVSIFATPNRVPVEYAYDFSNIAFAYREYRRLMEHWRKILPADRFLEVRYEDLVRDREAQTRRMLEFVGVEWDEAVLHHERNVRSVITPSLWQVRQPIYSTSVDRWRRYEPWVGKFVEELVS